MNDDRKVRVPALMGGTRRLRGRPGRWRRTLAGLLLAPALTACAGLPAPRTAETLRVGGLEVVARSPERQLIVFQTPDDVEKFCLAPPPDAVATYSEGISLGDAGVGVGESAGEGAGILGGRGQAALIVREILYRTCEITLNYHLEKDEALELYEDTLRTVQAVAKAHLGAGTAPAAAPSASPAEASPDENGDDDD